MIKKIFLFSFIFFSNVLVFGQNQKATNVLDFEDEVIEGERAAPSLFVQMDIQAPKMDSLVFQRKNFNDFHALDKFRKPKYRGQESNKQDINKQGSK